ADGGGAALGREICVARGRRPWRVERIELTHQRVDVFDVGGFPDQITDHHGPRVQPVTKHRANPALREIVDDLAAGYGLAVQGEDRARLNFRERGAQVLD